MGARKSDDNPRVAEEMIALRVGVDMLERVDEYAKKLEQEHRGIKVSRSAAMRALIEKGLSAE